MHKISFINIYFLLLLVACSETKMEHSNLISTRKTEVINSFVPEYLSIIPKINLPFKSYRKHNYENYVVEGKVDSLNLKQGYWEIHDVKNNLTYKGTYLNDLLDGWWQVLSGSTLICAGNYVQNKKQGYWGYLQIGQAKNSKYVNYKNDMLSGLAREFTIDSILISDGNYTRGLKNGYWKFYYPNGTLKEQGNYKDNNKSGWWENYDKNGKIYQEASYLRDEISGYVIKYLNGIISEEGKRFNGKKWGTWKYYDSYGNLIKIDEFDD
jgi:antitoxin component YwqK of YwqJK toxin-antitoxin module